MNQRYNIAKDFEDNILIIDGDRNIKLTDLIERHDRLAARNSILERDNRQLMSQAALLASSNQMLAANDLRLRMSLRDNESLHFQAREALANMTTKYNNRGTIIAKLLGIIRRFKDAPSLAAALKTMSVEA